MPTQKVIGSKTFTVPTSNDTGWGVTTTAYLLELGTYANQVAIASYDLTKNFRVNSSSVVADDKTVAQYGIESTFVAIKNYSASSAKFGALRLPEFGPAGSDNTYTETSSTNSNLGTYVSHNQINWKLTGGYFYLHSDNPALYSDASLVVQRLNSTNSPINSQTALAAAVADTTNLNVDTIVLAKTPATIYGKTLDTGGSNANTISNSDVVADAVAIWEGNNLSVSTVTKPELEALAGINTVTPIETRLSTLETDTGSISADVGNLGSTSTGIIAKTTESGTDVYAGRTITGTANRVTVTNGNGVSGNPTLDIGSDVVTLNGTQTLQNKEINTNINTIKGTASTMAHFDGSGNMLTTNNVPDSINFPSNEGVESTSAASTLNVGTTNNTTTLNLGTGVSTDTINIGTGAGTTNINIGGSGDTVTIAGTLVNVNTTNMDVTDHSITLNKGGTAANTSGAGISLEGGGGEVGYLRSDGSRIGTEFKSAARDGTTNIRHSTASANNILDLTNSTGNTYSFPANTGNVLIDTASQTVVGKQTQTSMAFVAESATVTTANLAPASTPPKVIQRITSSTATLGTITNTGGATNSELILVNVSGSAISILNDSGASSTSILTGTGSAISLANNASVIVIYDANSSRWRVVGGSGSGSGSGSSVSNNVNYPGHGFSVGEWLYLNGSTYTRAKADAANTASVVGVVSALIDTDNFTITTDGLVTGLTGLTAGADQFLSATTDGARTETEPTTVGYVSAPVGIAISTTSMYVSIKRGVVIGTSNVFTNIGLANNAATTIQNISSFANGEGGVLTGTIKIDATTDYTFGFEISFTKDTAGVINHSVRYFAGDIPTLSLFSVGTSGQNIQITLGSHAGFVNASARFQLAASAVSPTVDVSTTGTMSLTATGAVVGSFTCNYTLINNVVTLVFPANVVNGGSAAAQLTLSTLPVNLRPATKKTFVIGVQNSGGTSGTPGAIEVRTDGTLVAGATIPLGTFANAGNQGILATSLTYGLT